MSPKWDFTSGALAGHPSAFVVAAKAGDIPAPTGPPDVDWLSLTNVSGSLATQVFRVNTVGGLPPASVRPSILIGTECVTYYEAWPVHGWLAAYHR